MKRTFLAAVLLFLALTPTGCSRDRHDAPPVFASQVLSDSVYDGDIAQISPGVFSIAQGNNQSVFAGVDPVTFTEYRAFLDFPLTGPGGVPGNAVILSATLDIVIDSIRSAGSVPLLIDLVAFQPPTLVASDYDRTVLQPLATVSFSPPISGADVGRHVIIDVTSLMSEAQRLGLADFQVRILEDFGASAGLIEINDITGPDRGSFAPLLRVTYY